MALNEETAALDAALLAGIRGGTKTVSALKAMVGKSDDFTLRLTQERKIAKRLDALRRAGFLKHKNGFWSLAEKSETTNAG